MASPELNPNAPAILPLAQWFQTAATEDNRSLSVF